MEQRTTQIERVAVSEAWSLLCTNDGAQTHMALLPYAAESSSLLFVVASRDSDAWQHISADYRVAVIPRSRTGEGIADAAQVPLGIGCASECTGAAAQRAKGLLASRHADIGPLLDNDDTVIICVTVDDWHWVLSVDSTTIEELAFDTPRYDGPQ